MCIKKYQCRDYENLIMTAFVRLLQLENKLKFSFCHSLVPLRYHYYGIAVKESSQYYDVMYSKKGAAWVNETGKKEVTKQTVAYSPRSKLGTLLPDFPNVKDLNLPASLPEEKVNRSLKPLTANLQLQPPSPSSGPLPSPLDPAFMCQTDLPWAWIQMRTWRIYVLVPSELLIFRVDNKISHCTKDGHQLSRFKKAPVILNGL